MKAVILVAFAALPNMALQAQESSPWVWAPSDVAAEFYDLGDATLGAGEGLSFLAEFRPVGGLGRGAYAFGTVSTVEFTGDGAVIIDAMSPRVVAVSRRGEIRWEMRQTGEGPLDLSMPTSGLVVGDALLLGSIDGRVREYDLSTGKPEYRQEWRLSGPVYDFCATSRFKWVQSWDLASGTLVRRVGDSGSRSAAQGIARLISNGGGRQSALALGEAVLECTSDETIVVAPRSGIPEIRAFRENGRLIWRLRLEGYQPVGLVLLNPGFRVEIPPDGYHRVESLTEIGDGRLLLQIGRVTRESLAAGMVVEYISLTLDGTTGRVLEASRGGPKVHQMRGDCLAVSPKQLEPEVRFSCR